MNYILFLFAAWSLSFLTLFLKKNTQAVFSFLLSLIITCVAGYWAIVVLSGGTIQLNLTRLFVFKDIQITIDYLSAIFILLSNFVFTVAAFYQINYLKKYSHDNHFPGVHMGAFVWTQIALTGMFITNHIGVFMIFWELMSTSSFLITLYKGEKETIKAAINYLVQMHVGVVFLVIGFVLLSNGTQEFHFDKLISSINGPSRVAITFLIMGFGVKAAMMPFHSWLPKVHPVCIGPVAAVMSGIVVNAGIYGIARIGLLLPAQYSLYAGSFILILSLITGLYGIINASIQNDIKRILAYSTVENMGIIGVGIGLGIIGKAINSTPLYYLGFTGAFLHVVNHAVYKSVLFMNAYEILNKTGSSSLETMGGLMKKMPFTGILFLAGSIGLMGLPPLSGFVSEFYIYKAIWSEIVVNDKTYNFIFVFVFMFFAFIGGFSVFAFTKTFGVVFLGNRRSEKAKDLSDLSTSEKIILSLPFLALGLLYFVWKESSTILNINKVHCDSIFYEINDFTWFYIPIGILAGLFILLYALRQFITSNRDVQYEGTWGCGYESPSAKMQYTSHSFGESVSELIPQFNYGIEKGEITKIFPEPIKFETHEEDKIGKNYMQKIAELFPRLVSPLHIFQNGKTQFYVLYSVLFLVALVLLTVTKIL
jgi:hydrogenase-4 component B